MLKPKQIKKLEELFREYEADRRQIGEAISRHKLPKYFLDRYSEALEEKLLYRSVTEVFDPEYLPGRIHIATLKLVMAYEQLQGFGLSKKTALEIVKNQPLNLE